MNEFETDLENTTKPALHGAADGIPTVMEPGRNSFSAVGRRVGREAKAAKAALHRNPCLTVLAAIAGGTLLGFLLAGMLNGRTR